jgi:hypothetical protein
LKLCMGIRIWSEFSYWKGTDDRERLMGMLRGHVANGETVRKEDIESFFAGLRRGGE